MSVGWHVVAVAEVVAGWPGGTPMDDELGRSHDWPQADGDGREPPNLPWSPAGRQRVPQPFR